MSGTDLTILVAFAAGVISFLSPCVLPLVPAYLGQLTAIAVAANASGLPPSRWTAMRHAFAFVAGFGGVFTLLGITATFAAGPIVDYLPALRMIGGVILIVLGPQPGGDPPHPAPRADVAPTGDRRGDLTGVDYRLGRVCQSVLDAVDRRSARWPRREPGWRAGSRRSGSARSSPIGWTPCIGIILGGILTMAASSTTVVQGGVLLVAYTLGLGLPFLLIAAVYDRAPRVMAPLVRHGKVVSLIGGLLVALIGVAMLFDWLAILPRYFTFNTAI